MDEHFQFDREKFKDVVHFAIFEVETIYGRQALGNVKLHKVLFLAGSALFQVGSLRSSLPAIR